MDTLTFIAQLIESLAWPGVVLAAVIVLRKPLRELLPLLRRAKYKDLDILFGQKLEKLEEKADQAKLPAPAEPPPWAFESPDDWMFGDYIERLAPVSPRVAISEAWRFVGLALKEAARKLGQRPSHNILRVARALQEADRLPRDAVSLLADLQGLRNRAVHASDFEMEPNQALEFARLAERLIASIRVEGAQGSEGAR